MRVRLWMGSKRKRDKKGGRCEVWAGEEVGVLDGVKDVHRFHTYRECGIT